MKTSSGFKSLMPTAKCSPSYLALLVVVPLLSLTPQGYAKEAPATPPEPAKEEIVVLSPFEVNTTTDIGFVGTNVLVGGRLANDLKDTPIAYSVLTREFIDALDIQNVIDASQWTVNATNSADDGRFEIFGAPTAFTFRGVSANATQRDFFPYPSFIFDSYNLDRYDFARGPNSILFGIGSLGGTANLVSKKARVEKATRNIRLTYGSWENYRTTLDINQPITDKAAVRLNLLYQDRDAWRDLEWEQKTAIHIAGTYKPTRALSFHGEAEFGKFDRNTPLTTIADGVSGWDGVSVFSAPLLTTPADANQRGILRYTGTSFIYAPFVSAEVFSAANAVRTQGGNLTAAIPVGGVLVVGQSASVANQPITETLNLPSDRFDRAIAGSEFYVPERGFAIGPSSPSHVRDYQILSGSVNYQLGSQLFFEGAGNYALDESAVELIGVRGLTTAFIDLNRYLPDGTTNRGYLKPYNETPRQVAFRDNEMYHTRAALAYVLDRTRWGDFRFSVMGGQSWTENRAHADRFSVKLSTDPRRWPIDDPLRFRFYWDERGTPLAEPASVTYNGAVIPTFWIPDLVNNTSMAVNSTTLRYAQAAFSGSLLRGRLKVVAAVRTDDYESESRISLVRGDYPANWDGTQVYFKPKAPADYLTLTYTPKSATGVATGSVQEASARPRDASGIGLPQYVNDRFVDDYSPNGVSAKVTTISVGGVFHLTQRFGVFGNYAESFNPGTSLQTIDGGLLGPQESKGMDMGLRFNSGSGRISANLLYYQGEETNNPAQPGVASGFPVAIPTAINQIYAANAVGDLSAGGQNIRGANNVPSNYSDRRRRETEGFEFELVGNITPAWRVSLNMALPQAVGLDSFLDSKKYLEANGELLKQIVIDAGGIIDSNNVASVNAAIPINIRSPDVATAVTAYNGLQGVMANIISGPQKLTRLVEVNGNMFSDYTFRSGALRNVKIGGGVNYRGKEIIGFRGSDTIVNPTNPTQTIDDPSVSATDPVYRDPYLTATFVVGYKQKLFKKYTVNWDLKIDNLLNHTDPIYYNAVLRPANGDLTSPARVATPNQFSYLVPRNYSLSVSLQF